MRAHARLSLDSLCLPQALTLLIGADALLLALARFSCEYFVPLRPLLLVLRNFKVRDAAFNFLRTMFAARDIVVTFIVVLLIATISGIMLFRDELGAFRDRGPGTLFSSTPTDASFFLVGLDPNTYLNFFHAVITTFVFITTGENFTEVVYPAFQRSPWYLAYFVVFNLVGMFFVLAMLIGTFEDGFRRVEEDDRQFRLLYTRVGAVSAFALLDLEMTESVPRKGLPLSLSLFLSARALSAAHRTRRVRPVPDGARALPQAEPRHARAALPPLRQGGPRGARGH